MSVNLAWITATKMQPVMGKTLASTVCATLAILGMELSVVS